MTIRPTGIDTPIGGFSWEFTKSDKECANRILKFMEDRRVLYNPQMSEVPRQCIASVQEIRDFLTDEIKNNSDGMKINNEIELMRRYCRDFLNKVEKKELCFNFWNYSFSNHDSGYRNDYDNHQCKIETDFLLALAVFRKEMIGSIAKLSSEYDIKLCEELSIMIKYHY